MNIANNILCVFSLFSDSNGISPVFKSLAIRFENYFYFNVMKNPSEEDLKAIGIRDHDGRATQIKVPGFLVMVIGGMEKGEPDISIMKYDVHENGPMQYSHLMKFLFSVNEKYRPIIAGDYASQKDLLMVDILEIERRRFNIGFKDGAKDDARGDVLDNKLVKNFEMLHKLSEPTMEESDSVNTESQSDESVKAQSEDEQNDPRKQVRDYLEKLEQDKKGNTKDEEDNNKSTSEKMKTKETKKKKSTKKKARNTKTKKDNKKDDKSAKKEPMNVDDPVNNILGKIKDIANQHFKGNVKVEHYGAGSDDTDKDKQGKTKEKNDKKKKKKKKKKKTTKKDVEKKEKMTDNDNQLKKNRKDEL